MLEVETSCPTQRGRRIDYTFTVGSHQYVDYAQGCCSIACSFGQLISSSSVSRVGDVGKFFEKRQRMWTGQVNTNKQLRDLIIAWPAEPTFLVSKVLPLGDAADAYTEFDNREDDYSTIILKPQIHYTRTA